MPSPPSELHLIERCLGGDEDAWRELITRYQALIYSVPRRMGLSPEDSADVFQRVCVTLYQRLGAVRDPSRLGGWLMTTATREALRAARGVRRDVPINADPEDDAPAFDPADVRPLADEVCAELERAQALRSALAELSDRCRLILEEFLREDASPNYKDVARRLDVPIGSLGPTRARCLARLREILRERGITGV
jgi:RNA polymerase sigma factor (sigma-70 family)